jgi:hypothetical protein
MKNEKEETIPLEKAKGWILVDAAEYRAICQILRKALEIIEIHKKHAKAWGKKKK